MSSNSNLPAHALRPDRLRRGRDPAGSHLAPRIRAEPVRGRARRTITEVSGWLPGFKARLGDAFPHQAELDEKRAEMTELDAQLAATPGETASTEAAA